MSTETSRGKDTTHGALRCPTPRSNTRPGVRLTLPPLDLTAAEDDVARLLAPDGRLYRIYVSDKDALEF
jgi:hypothetical protein